MSIYTGIHIEGSTGTDVCRVLYDYLTEAGGFDGPLQYKEASCNWIRNFLVPDLFPSIFVVSESAESREVRIAFNSFHQLDDLAPHLSLKLKTFLLVYHNRSTSESHYLATYRNEMGERRIVVGDGTVLEQTGENYEFEDDPLGDDLSEEDDERDKECYFFSYEYATAYIRSLGFSVEADYRPTGVFKHKKPWWNFWSKE